MKTTAITTLLALAFSPLLFADEKDKHEHDHGVKAGPTGGRLITEVEPHAEFYVNKENKIEIRFVNDENEIVAPAGQTVSVIMGDRANPTKLAFANQGDKLVSDQAIPAGNNHPTVVQIKNGEGVKTVTERFNLNLSKCPTCEFQEYACICDHDHEDEKSKEKKE